MSCRDSKPASPLSSKEFKEKVLKRGLELHNWAAVCREFGVPRKTLFRWRHKYANLLQQLASEMSVNVHYNPPVENQTGKSNSSTKKLLTSGYSCLKKDIKPSFLPVSRRRGKAKTKHQVVSGEKFSSTLDLVNEEEQTYVGESMVSSEPMTSGTSYMIIERQSDSLNLNTPCLLLTHNNDTGQLYHVATHPDQPAVSHICVPSSCTERAEMPAMVSELVSGTVEIASTDTTRRHVEFKEKVLKRGLELHNWAAVCREFGVPRKTLFRWRHRYANLLQQLSSEMSVNVHYNPPVENQTDKSVCGMQAVIRKTQKKQATRGRNKKNRTVFPVSHFLLDKETKNISSKEERSELVSLLPELNQVDTSSEDDLSETAFSNEYFEKSPTEWHDDVLCESNQQI